VEIEAGLCARCRHSEIVVSSRGARFYFCRVSLVDPRFPKYPSLPVLACERYEPAEELTKRAADRSE
jgi:hypothetical protein